MRALALSTVMLLSGCTGADDVELPGAASATFPPLAAPGGFVADFDNSPDFFTLTQEPVAAAPSPHGSVRIWYSVNIEFSLGTPGFEAPPGTTAIKRADRDGDGDADAILVMVKREPGYDPPRGDWYYEVRSPDGALLASPTPGANPACSGCHSAAAASDYLAGASLRSVRPGGFVSP